MPVMLWRGWCCEFYKIHADIDSEPEILSHHDENNIKTPGDKVQMRARVGK